MLVLSNRADLISAGDALVSVRTPAGVSASDPECSATTAARRSEDGEVRPLTVGADRLRLAAIRLGQTLGAMRRGELAPAR